MSILDRIGLILFLVIVAFLAMAGISVTTWEFWVIIPLILIRDILKEKSNKTL